MKVLSAKNLFKTLSVQPGLALNIALHASPTARISACRTFTLPVQPTFASLQILSKNEMMC